MDTQIKATSLGKAFYEKNEDLGNVSGTLELDFAKERFQTGTMTGNITGQSFVNVPPAPYVGLITYTLIDGEAFDFTFDAKFRTNGGAVPLHAGGSKKVWTIWTDDGGTTYNLVVLGSNMVAIP